MFQLAWRMCLISSRLSSNNNYIWCDESRPLIKWLPESWISKCSATARKSWDVTTSRTRRANTQLCIQWGERIAQHASHLFFCFVGIKKCKCLALGEVVINWVAVIYDSGQTVVIKKKKILSLTLVLLTEIRFLTGMYTHFFSSRATAL